MDKVFDPQTQRDGITAGWELQNMLTVCALIATAAHTRNRVTRVHYRIDFPKRDDTQWRVHLLWRRPGETPIPEAVEVVNQS